MPKLDFLHTDFERVSYLANLLTSRATGLSYDEEEYVMLREMLINDSVVSTWLPSFVRQHRSLDSFWSFIKTKFGTYAERRTFLSEQFTPLLDFLEFGEPVKTPPQMILNPAEQQALKRTSQEVDSSYHQVGFSNQNPIITRNKRKVFIVHGRDNEAKQEVARFISDLGLEPIVLHEQASQGRTIIEKIERYTNDADFALVLYTACDHGRGAYETKVSPRNRARQNVVFEHGYLMAKLGRENVCALVKGDIETPNDISGVVYVSLDSSGGWKISVMTELKSCGYDLRSIF
ncbi:nucleotide-binding protein [Lelliottia sp. T2.26D-8]|uniref:nucleotide-binding protein n=1 Tax=Lelliottia sp. T2.26D-8 TaxID=3041165 RepID=UPI00254083C0|nr:nucleotide-binding protein [Lelliottia sp. T2.26D-8]